MPSKTDEHVIVPNPNPPTPQEPKHKPRAAAHARLGSASEHHGANPLAGLPIPQPRRGSEPEGPQSHVQRPGDPPPTDEPKVTTPAPVAPGTSG